MGFFKSLGRKLGLGKGTVAKEVEAEVISDRIKSLSKRNRLGFNRVKKGLGKDYFFNRKSGKIEHKRKISEADLAKMFGGGMKKREGHKGGNVGRSLSSSMMGRMLSGKQNNPSAGWHGLRRLGGHTIMPKSKYGANSGESGLGGSNKTNQAILDFLVYNNKLRNRMTKQEMRRKEKGLGTSSGTGKKKMVKKVRSTSGSKGNVSTVSGRYSDTRGNMNALKLTGGGSL